MNILAILNWRNWTIFPGATQAGGQCGELSPVDDDAQSAPESIHVMDGEDGPRLANMRIRNERRSRTTQQNLLNVARKVTSDWSTTRTKIRTAELHWFCPVAPVYEREPAEYQRANELMHKRILATLSNNATLPFHGFTEVDVLAEADSTWSPDEADRVVDEVEGHHWLNAPEEHDEAGLPTQDSRHGKHSAVYWIPPSAEQRPGAF